MLRLLCGSMCRAATAGLATSPDMAMLQTSAMADDAGLKLHNELSHCLGSVGRLWLSHSMSAYSLISRPVMASLLGMATQYGAVA